MRDVVIVSAARTAIGRLMGGLASVRAPRLGEIAVRAAIERAGIGSDRVEEVILGNVIGAGLGQNPARQAQIAAGVPSSTGALTINKVCGSGLRAVSLAGQIIRAGDAGCVIAGGMENMSQAPHLLLGSRNGTKLGHTELTDANVHDGLWDRYNDYHMGMTGELVAKEYGISREEQDAFALESHMRAAAAQEAGRFSKEIAAVDVPQRRGDPVSFDKDESVRPGSTLESLGRLRPAFKNDGTVTAGNAPGLNDGAAALVIMSADAAKAEGLTPLAKITGWATGHRDPEWVMMAPVTGVQKLTKKLGMGGAGEFDLVELNEAFSVAAIAVTRELGLDLAKVNVNGGAVALGHPIGASGARILVTLLHALEQRDLTTGLAALCLGGGGSVAVSIERV
ncbi:MAG: acetyl-CoA C-acetyltransferase [Planctomycetota bacterium]|jgi:acetyl-CoA C-acetyltransferase